MKNIFNTFIRRLRYINYDKLMTQMLNNPASIIRNLSISKYSHIFDIKSFRLFHTIDLTGIINTRNIVDSIGNKEIIPELIIYDKGKIQHKYNAIDTGLLIKILSEYEI